MKNKKAKLAVAICCLGSLAATNVGRAALTQIYVTANSGVGGLTSTAYDTVNGGASSGWSGNWSATITGGFIPGGHPTSWESFCLDLGNLMSGNATYDFTASAFSAGDPPANNPPDPRWVTGGGMKAGYLYANHLADVVNATTRSALAIAIWEVLYESDTSAYSVSAHNATKGFEVVNNASGATAIAAANLAISTANTWLSDAMGAGFNNAPTTTWWKENAASDPQSLIGPTSAVPEPSTYLAGALLLLPFAASTIRRRFKVS